MAKFVVRKQVIFLALLAVVGTASTDKIDAELLGFSGTNEFNADHAVWNELRASLFSYPGAGSYKVPGHLIQRAVEDFQRLTSEGRAQSRVRYPEIHLMADTVVIPAIRLNQHPVKEKNVPKWIQNFRELYGPYVRRLRAEPYKVANHPKTAALIQSLSGNENAVPYHLIKDFRQEYKRILQEWLEFGERGEFGINVRKKLVKFTNYMNMKEVRALKKLVLLEGEFVRDGAVSDELREVYFHLISFPPANY